jgi:hypothetical protein
MKKKNQHSVALGRVGGRSRSTAEVAASRENERLSGRKRELQAEEVHEQRPDSAEDVTKNVTAYHEAGHVVVAIYLELKVKGVTIESDKYGLSYGGVEPERLRKRVIEQIEDRTLSLRSKDHIERYIRAALAGSIAQHRYSPQSFENHHAKGDDSNAFQLALALASDNVREAEAWLNLLHIQTESLIELCWFAVEAVAQALLERHTLIGDELQKVCQSAFMNSPKRERVELADEREERR